MRDVQFFHLSKNKLSFLLPAILLSLFSLPSLAVESSSSTSVRELQRLIRSEQKKCPPLNCQDRRVLIEKLSTPEFKALGTETRAQLRSLARGQALDLWPDTVLEGPYHVQFRVRLDQIQSVKVDGREVAYRLTFSDKAWNKDLCTTGPEALRIPQYRNCQTGRIFDAIYVTEDLKSSFRDTAVRAQYYADGASNMPLSVPAQTDLSLNSRKRRTLSGFSRLNLPLENNSCTRENIVTTLAQNHSLIEDLIYDERGLRVCDDNERSAACFEASSLFTLLSQVYEVTGTPDYETDSGYALCDHSPECQVQARMRCLGQDLIFELK